jgi:hypothetical protein
VNLPVSETVWGMVFMLLILELSDIMLVKFFADEFFRIQLDNKKKIL